MTVVPIKLFRDTDLFEFRVTMTLTLDLQFLVMWTSLPAGPRWSSWPAFHHTSCPAGKTLPPIRVTVASMFPERVEGTESSQILYLQFFIEPPNSTPPTRQLLLLLTTPRKELATHCLGPPSCTPQRRVKCILSAHNLQGPNALH